MNENERAILILSVLETGSFRTKELYQKLRPLGYNTNDRNLTHDRDMGYIQTKGIALEQNAHKWTLECDDSYSNGVASILKEILQQDNYKKLTHGEVLQKTLEENLNKINTSETSACFIERLLKALKNTSMLKYDYRPQHQDTVLKLKEHKNEMPKGTPEGCMVVVMLPRLLVFGGEEMVILGESYLQANKEPRLRQYALPGICNIRGPIKSDLPLRMENRKVEKNIFFDPDILYRHSLYLWQGGQTHQITLEEHSPGNPDIPRLYNKTVNGEEEILSHVAASLGKLKIVNPPPLIEQKAKEYNLTANIFIYR